MPHEIINSLSLYHEQAGQGAPLVFLHGFTGSTRDWDRQIPVFSKQYNVIAVDHRGHGKSEAPSSEEDYSIYLFTDDVYGLLKKLNIHRC